MNLKLQNKMYDSSQDLTLVNVTNDKPYALLTAELKGNQTHLSDDDLLSKSMDFVFKTYFVDRAMPEAIEKVDKVSVEVTETRELLSELQEAMNVAEMLISELNSKTQNIEEKQNKINEAFVLSDNLSDEQKAIFMEQFEEFEVGKSYATGDIVSFEGDLFKVVQSHTSQGDWIPNATPALYTPLKNTTTVIDGEEVEVISEWTQPTGSHDAYNIGDKVQFEGKAYESVIDTNTWSPTGYPQGWKEVE